MGITLAIDVVIVLIFASKIDRSRFDDQKINNVGRVGLALTACPDLDFRRELFQLHNALGNRLVGAPGICAHVVATQRR